MSSCYEVSLEPLTITPELDSLVVDRLLDIGDERTFGLGRTPGPKAILYDLAGDESLQQAGGRLPRSTRTIHRLLRDRDALPLVCLTLRAYGTSQADAALATRFQRCLQRPTRAGGQTATCRR